MRTRASHKSLFFLIVAFMLCVGLFPLAANAAVENIGDIEEYNKTNILKGYKDLNSMVGFDINDPVFIVFGITVKAKKKVNDKITFALQKHTSSGYKTIWSFNRTLKKEKYTFPISYNNGKAGMLKEGYYRLIIKPKNKPRSFYKADCFIYVYHSIKEVSPSKLKKKYKLSPGEICSIAASNGDAQLYFKNEPKKQYSGIYYSPVANEWFIAADTTAYYSTKEKLKVKFANGKSKTTTVIISPLRWWYYTLQEGKSFKEYYYRWDGKWRKWKVKNVKWYSTNKRVATVSKSGKVKARGLGKCYIIGKYRGKVSKCKVTVYASKPRKGMTAKQVRNSNWGSPTRRNDYGDGFIQWVYDWGDGEIAYVHFRHGRVTNITRYNY